MRYLVASLLLVLSGCLAVQEPHNPVVPPEGVAPVASTAAAPAVSSTECEDGVCPLPSADPPQSKVELMKEMYLAQRTLNQEILRLAGVLTTEELAELNEWLQQYGVQLHRKKVEAPTPTPRQSRAY